MLNVLRHQLDLFLGHDVVEVIHTTFGTKLDDTCETLGTFFHGFFRFQAFTRGPFTQNTMTASTTLEVGSLRLFEFCLCHRRWRFFGSVGDTSNTHPDGHGEYR